MAPTFLVLFLVIFSWTAVMAEKSTQVDKRLLLDDPQTVSSQMLSLQREIQILQTKIAEIDVHQSQFQLINAQISQLQHENDALKLQISQISQGASNQDVQTLNTKMASLEALHLDHELPLLKSNVDAVMKENQHLLQHSGTINLYVQFMYIVAKKDN